MKTKIPKKSVHILPILANFQAELLQIYGENLEGIILFGSYARGDFRQGSDIDLLLLFDENFAEFKKDDAIFDVIVNYMMDKKVVITPLGIQKKFFESRKTPLMLNVQREGIELWKK